MISKPVHRSRLLMLGTFVFCGLSVFAQKLPDSQESPLRAPANVKVDGKPLEWPSMQAFSKSTQIMYTLANDDSTLYLVAQSNVQGITSKILAGGITFTLSADGKKKEKGGIAITYPVPPPPMVISQGANMAGGGGGGGTFTVVSGGSSLSQTGSPAEIKKRRDSMMFVNTTKRIAKFTEVKVLGVPAIKDSLLSIYNEEGVKARVSYEENGLLTYELAVPFKYLGIDIANPAEFVYNVKLNGRNMGIALGNVSAISINGSNGQASASNDFMNMMSVTDFWGKYTPAKRAN